MLPIALDTKSLSPNHPYVELHLLNVSEDSNLITPGRGILSFIGHHSDYFAYPTVVREHGRYQRPVRCGSRTQISSGPFRFGSFDHAASFFSVPYSPLRDYCRTVQAYLQSFCKDLQGVHRNRIYSPDEDPLLNCLTA